MALITGQQLVDKLFRRGPGHEKRAERATALGFRVNQSELADRLMTKLTLLGASPPGGPPQSTINNHYGI